MTNIFENAYFGKSYKTRDGKKVLYNCYDDQHKVHFLFDEGNSFHYSVKEGGNFTNEEHPKDIIAEWQKEIDEEKLNKLANEYASSQCYDVAEYCCTFDRDNLYEAYKAGYRKALES